MSRMTETWHYLFIAVLTLAAGSEPLPERLARAYESGLWRALTEQHWPDGVTSEVAELKSQLERVLPTATPGMSMQVIKAAFAEAEPEIVRSIARLTVLLYRRLVEHATT